MYNIETATGESVVSKIVSPNLPIAQFVLRSTWEVRSRTEPNDSPNAIAADYQLLAPPVLVVTHTDSILQVSVFL
jgi:hypothetical protein